MLLKLGIPVRSITRSEWLEKTRADGYIFAAAAELDTAQVNWILHQLKDNRFSLLIYDF